MMLKAKINNWDILKGINYKDDIYKILALRIFTIKCHDANLCAVHTNVLIGELCSPPPTGQREQYHKFTLAH